MSVEYAIIVKNKTRLETLIERFNTMAQAKFYIERSGGNFDDYELENVNFHQSLASVQRQLSTVIKNKIVERSFLPSFLFSEKNVVVVVGQDGLVANTAKYVNKIPIVAVNPDLDRFDGFLLPFRPDDFIGGVEQVMSGSYRSRIATLAEAKLNDGQRILAFNDLFIGAASHVSARYRISYNGQTEDQSSSGIIVSTQVGSTGWLSSLFNMSYGVHNFVEHTEGEAVKTVTVNNDELIFVVREPFLSKKSKIDVTSGLFSGETRLVIESFMPTRGVIFSDGIEADFLNFNSGSIATIGTAPETATLVMPGS